MVLKQCYIVLLMIQCLITDHNKEKILYNVHIKYCNVILIIFGSAQIAKHRDTE